MKKQKVVFINNNGIIKMYVNGLEVVTKDKDSIILEFCNNTITVHTNEAKEFLDVAFTVKKKSTSKKSSK